MELLAAPQGDRINGLGADVQLAVLLAEAATGAAGLGQHAGNTSCSTASNALLEWLRSQVRLRGGGTRVGWLEERIMGWTG